MFRACLLDNIALSLGNSGANGFFSQLMKTFTSSKILYTPNNRHTRKIMERVGKKRSILVNMM